MRPQLHVESAIEADYEGCVPSQGPFGDNCTGNRCKLLGCDLTILIGQWHSAGHRRQLRGILGSGLGWKG